MNINPNFSDENENAPASEVMALGMDFIYENLIEPVQENLNTDQLKIISLIGMSFKIIAEQATALEELEKSMEGLDNNEDISRN
jgi:hypothetical protein